MGEPSAMPETLKEALLVRTDAELDELRTWAESEGHVWLVDAIDDAKETGDG